MTFAAPPRRPHVRRAAERAVSDSYGPRHAEVRELRALARDPRARSEAATCLLEGPRVIEAALDRQAEITGAYFAHGAPAAFASIRSRLAEHGVPIHVLKEGVLERIGTTRTPQPVLALARWAPTPIGDVASRADRGPVVVAHEIADPGNLGTILRSAEAAGAAGVVVAGAGVDVRNPKVVRASSGALFGVPVAEGARTGPVIDELRAGGVRILATAARGGADPATVDLMHRVAIVVGNEARGLTSELVGHVDGTLTIPMSGSTESLNVAMAATVLCFEAARQRAHGAAQ